MKVLHGRTGMGQCPLERASLGGQLLDEHGAIMRAKLVGSQQRRAGIETGLSALAAQLRDQLQIVADFLGRRSRGGVGQAPRLEPPDAGGGLAGGSGQVVGSAAGVRLEIEKALVLALQGAKQRQQRHVLMHVREIAGVMLVAVFQIRLIRGGSPSMPVATMMPSRRS